MTNAIYIINLQYEQIQIAVYQEVRKIAIKNLADPSWRASIAAQKLGKIEFSSVYSRYPFVEYGFR